jgi:hypothetical protein
MPIVLFNHARVGVTQVLRHHEQRHAVHNCMACPGVPERVETDRRLDLSVLTRLRRRAELVRGTPRLAVGFAQHDFAGDASGGELTEERHALIGQHDMAGLARFGPTDR